MSNGSLRNPSLEEVAGEQDRANNQVSMPPPPLTDPQVAAALTRAYEHFTIVLEHLLDKPQQEIDHQFPNSKGRHVNGDQEHPSLSNKFER
ncbi:hypothetical protein JCGZ_05581 [Jatropha curcas]|uniref:Uncharacterized protein n=1 Tax=Jatropha curcas TaxID=180498 RepID=A0A067LIN7_JATCU|nr:hypothetical protein JCGZ_05581 [Jatropha curcas]